MSKLSSFSKKIMNLLPDSLVVAGRVWQRVCPRNLVGPVEMFLVGPSLSEIAEHFLAIIDKGHTFRRLQCQIEI